jgi:hypothetical protein
VKKNIVEDALALPETHDAILKRREQLRLRAMQEMARLESNLWDRLDGLIEAGDPQEIDALTRALLTLERIAASAAGDGRTVAREEASVPVEPAVVARLWNDLMAGIHAAPQEEAKSLHASSPSGK